jgi:predicted naringenin-chalcone synthase
MHPDEAQEEEEHLDDVEVEGCIIRSSLSSSSVVEEDLSPKGTTQRECSWEYGGGVLRLPKQMQRPAAKRGSCSLIGYGLATPGEEHKWTQAEVADMLKIPEAHPHRSLFRASHIQTRYLAELIRDLEDPAKVTLTRLREKHLHWAQVMLSKAIKDACADARIEPSELGHVSVCSTSGYLLPGLSAYVARDKTLNISPEISRQDIVGMGCHAGLNSLKSAASWACNNPGRYAVACGVEVMSAQYVWGDATKAKLNNVICNSLFGDGCFAAVFYSAPPEEEMPPKAYLDMPPRWWAQYVDTGALDDMIYHVEESEGKYRFDLSELAPYHVSQGLLAMMRSALGLSIPVHCADHVVMHTGGRTVLNCSMAGLGLEGDPQRRVPWTVDALRDFGNQSSSSFLFAFDRLVRSGACSVGDAGLFVTMGPGAGLEMAMWTAGERFGYPYSD